MERWSSPCACDEVLSLWAKVFGEAEAALEAPQIDGTEAAENSDFLLVLRERERLVGTLHATVPRAAPELCGLSGMCIAPEYRGQGFARRLFGAMLAELDASGVRTVFLGTDNPAAAALYASCGFGFLPGSNVMARFREESAAAFFRRNLEAPRDRFDIRRAIPGMRVPLIPLVLHRGSQFLLDRNAGLFSSAAVTQRSCMGLYPRYETILRAGGGCCCAWAEGGVLGAVASVKPTEDGPLADFFCCDAFLPAVPELLERCREEYGTLRFQIAESDAGKRSCLERLGYRAGDTAWIPFDSIRVPGVNYGC